MFESQTVIYTARTRQDAYLLKNLLAEERIEAVVINDMLEGGSGVDIVGWPTAARVVVARSDAARARHIALVFDRKLATATGDSTAEGGEPQPAGRAPEHWPRCPECDAPRATRCRVCGTAGSDFGPADSGFLDILAPEAAAQASSGIFCGPGGCASAEAGSGAAAAGKGKEPDASAAMLLCPTCDEPFVPEYARRCEWCGHEFGDGYEAAPVGDSDPINARLIGVLIGLVLAAAAGMAYVMFGLGWK